MKRLLLLASLLVALAVGGVALAQQATNNTHMAGYFSWGATAYGLTPGHVYTVEWYYRGESTTCNGRTSPCEYWLGSNAPAVNRYGTLVIPAQQLEMITGHAEFPDWYPDDTDGYYQVTLQEPGMHVPAVGPDGQPLIFEQELE